MTDVPVQPARSRKGLALGVGGAVLAVAAIGGGVWGYDAFFGQGDQPAQALPAKGLLGYVSLDLSPNGEQLLAARSTLKKFPGVADQLDLDSKADLRKLIFDKIKGEDSGCAGLDDYDKDVKPWLGDRVALAALDAGAHKTPTPVIVIQTSNHAKAKAALSSLVTCMDADMTGADEKTSSAFNGDWLVLAQGAGKAQAAVDAAKKGTLADDDTFATWTGAAGDPGIVTAYGSKLGYERMTEVFEGLAGGAGVPASLTDQAKKFKGVGVVARFADEGLEVETASQVSGDAKEIAKPVGDLVGSLPKSTVAAFGVGLADGWFDTMRKAYGPALEDEAGMSLDQAESELTRMTGLTFDDIETLLGEGVAISVDSSISGDAIQQGDVASVPVGIKIKGDSGKIEKVLDKLREAGAAQGMPRGFVVSKKAGDDVVVTISAKYADKLAADKGLGDSSAFKKLVPHADDALSAFFVDFDASGWLDSLLEGFGLPQDVRDNVAPLSGLGVTTWADGDQAHALVKIATD